MKLVLFLLIGVPLIHYGLIFLISALLRGWGLKSLPEKSKDDNRWGWGG